MIVLENGRVLDPASGLDAVRTVVIEGDRIARIVERPGDRPAGATVIDCSGKWIVPGLIDLHVHLREPGEEYKETIETGARAAVAGGFTAVVAMPNTKPPVDNATLVAFVRERAEAAGLCRVYPAGAISKKQEGKDLADVGEMRDAGAVAVTDDGKPVVDAGLMRRALEYTRAFDLPVMVHEEEPSLARGVMHEGEVSTRLGLRGTPGAAESVMVLRDLALAELTGGRLHVAHVSVAESVRAIRAAKARGVRVTAEATPHHFTLTDEAVAASDYSPNTKMNPPLRAATDVQAIREALADGTIDAIATDHAPHSQLEKDDLEFDLASNGIVGLETSVPLTLALVRDGVLSPLRAIELLSAGPARIFRLPGGKLAAGAVADVTVIDPEERWTVRAAEFRSKGRNTPFEGHEVQGRAAVTVVGGRIVHGAGAGSR
jgi:dihydroorotase